MRGSHLPGPRRLAPGSPQHDGPREEGDPLRADPGLPPASRQPRSRLVRGGFRGRGVAADVPRMSPSLTDTLCTRCGLCCDGSLFADVELAGRAEATRLEIMGLRIGDDDADGALLEQPCRALRGRRCGIYEHRPGCCRTFECRLLEDVRRGTVGVARAQERIAEALKRIGRVRDLAAHLARRDVNLPLREGCDEALARAADADPRASRKRAELEAAMSAVEKLLRKTFLDGAGRSHAHRATGGDEPS